MNELNITYINHRSVVCEEISKWQYLEIQYNYNHFFFTVLEVLKMIINKYPINNLNIKIKTILIPTKVDLVLRPVG